MKISFFGLLTLVFVGCKLAGVIDWSWWLVMSPMIVGSALFLLLCFGLALMGLGDD